MMLKTDIILGLIPNKVGKGFREKLSCFLKENFVPYKLSVKILAYMISWLSIQYVNKTKPVKKLYAIPINENEAIASFISFLSSGVKVSLKVAVSHCKKLLATCLTFATTLVKKPVSLLNKCPIIKRLNVLLSYKNCMRIKNISIYSIYVYMLTAKTFLNTPSFLNINNALKNSY